MTARISAFLLCVLLTGAPAQREPQPADPAIRVTHMRADLEFLASPELEGRVSGERGSDVAARFIATEFEKAGLKPANGNSYFQPFDLLAYQTDPAASELILEVNGKREALQRGTEFRGGGPQEVAVSGDLVFAGYGITAPEYGYDDYAGIDVTGKVVLIFDHEPQENDPQSKFNGTGHTRYAIRRAKLLNAQKHGAVAVLVASEPVRTHPSPFEPPAVAPAPNRGNAPPQVLKDDELRIPAFSVSDAAAAKLLATAGQTPAELQRVIDQGPRPASRVLPGCRVEMRSKPSRVQQVRSANVVGFLEGFDPSSRAETVLLTAHYDHLGMRQGRIYPGANDNGSGTVAVMELARAFAAGGARPKRTLLFVIFGTEEEGLLGSYYYTMHPLRPLDKTKAVINLDMIGRDEEVAANGSRPARTPEQTKNELNLVGGQYSPGLVAVIQQQTAKVGLEMNRQFDRDHDQNVLFRCDHFPFLLRDVPAVWLFGGFHPGYHEPVDTVDRMDFIKLEKVTRLAYLTSRQIAE